MKKHYDHILIIKCHYSCLKTDKPDFEHTYGSIYNGDLTVFKTIQKWLDEDCVEHRKNTCPEKQILKLVMGMRVLFSFLCMFKFFQFQVVNKYRNKEWRKEREEATERRERRRKWCGEKREGRKMGGKEKEREGGRGERERKREDMFREHRLSSNHVPK